MPKVVDQEPNHPVAEVFRSAAGAAAPHVPPGYQWLTIIEAPDGIFTFGGNLSPAEMFHLIETAALRLMSGGPPPRWMRVGQGRADG